MVVYGLWYIVALSGPALQWFAVSAGHYSVQTLNPYQTHLKINPTASPVTQANRTSGFDKATSISSWKLWLAFTSHNAISKGIDYERCHIFRKLLTKFMFLPKTLKASFTQSMLARKQTYVIVVITLPWKGPRFLAPTILFRTMTINETARISW